MLQVPNNESENALKSCHEQLEEMGFSSTLIRQADYQSTDKSMSGLLNWLLTHDLSFTDDQKQSRFKPNGISNENHSCSSKKKAKNNKKLRNHDTTDEAYNLEKLTRDISDDLFCIYNKPFGASKKSTIPAKVFDSKQKAKITSPQSCPIQPQRLSGEALSEVKKILKDLEATSVSNSTELTRYVNDVLKEWKYSKGALEAEIVFALSYEDLKEEPLINLRSRLYQLVDKIFNMKLRREEALDLSAIETMLMNAHDLGVFSKQQIEKIKVAYIKFCRRIKVLESESLITHMERNVPRRGMPKLSLNSLEDGPDCGGALRARMKPKFSRLSDDEDEVEEELKTQGETPGSSGLDEKELCIICMDRVREIVYLPCAHFLACPLCSSRVNECPICCKKIENHLKIYWS